MKQIFYTDKGHRAIDVAMPTPGDNELLVAVYTSVISTGTETMGMNKNVLSVSENLREKKIIWDKVKKSILENGLKFTLEVIKDKLSPAEQLLVFQPVGYSNAGVVVAKGQLVKGFNIGDRVACAGAGIASHAEYTAIPVNLAVKIPNEVTFESAGFTTIGAIAMQGIRRANLSFGETVVIFGLGLLGLIAVQIAKAWGLVVIGADINPRRVELGKEMGADFCFNSNDKNFSNSIQDITHGQGADAVIIYAATRSSEPANMALNVCRKKARVVVVGAIGMDLQREAMYSKELDFVMSTSYGPGRYDNLYEQKGIDYPIGYVRWTENRNMMEFVRLLTSRLVKVDRLISNSYNIDQAEEAYESLIKNPSENISNIFIYSHEEKIIPVSHVDIHPASITKGKIRVGIIGAGGFVQKNHLANILGMPEDYELISIAEKTPGSAKAIGEKYKARYVTTDYRQLLNDPDIDLVIIGTRHNLHALLVIEAIKAGKNVLVEKPLAINHNELLMIEKAYKEHPQKVIAVGFNRRYSPLIQKVRGMIFKNATPVLINYRVNAGYIPQELWVQNLEEGGGRIIGEVCHFIDLVTYLASSSVKSINAIHMPNDDLTIKAEDNVIITMAFNNGSIGVITYTSIGGQEMEKERIEIFTNESSIVINDFIELRTYNCREKGTKLKEADKGHKMLITELSKKLRSTKSLVLSFETDIAITNHTLLVVDQIHRIAQ